MRRARPSLVFIAAGGCLVVVVLGAIAVAVAFLVGHATGAAGLPGASAPAPSAAPPPPATKVELVDLHELTDRGRTFLVGELANGGTSPAGQATVKLSLFSATRVQVGDASCASPLAVLAPGEKVPCLLAIAAPRDRWQSYETAVDARPPGAGIEHAPLVAPSPTWTRRAASGPNQIDGTVRNEGTRAAREVKVVVALYGNDGKLVGAGVAAIAAELRPGAAAAYTVTADALAAPKSFVVRAAGRR